MILEIVLVLLMNIIVLSCAYIYCRKLGIRGTINSILAIFQLYIFQIMVTEIILGIFWNHLFIKELILLNTIILFFAIIVIGTKTPNASASIIELKQMTKNISKINYILVIPLTMVVLLLFVVAIFWPPDGYDTYMYHLVRAAKWMQIGRVDYFAYNENPGGSELLFVWNTIAFHNDLLVDISQLLFAITGAIACYKLSKELGISSKNASISATLFLGTPIIILQSRTNYADLILASSLLFCLNFLFEYANKRQRSSLLLFIISTIITINTKLSGIIFVFPLYIYLLYKVFKNNNNLRRYRTHLMTIIILIVLSTSISIMVLTNNVEVSDNSPENFIKRIIINLRSFVSNPSLDYFYLDDKKIVRDRSDWLYYPFLDNTMKNTYNYEIGFGPQLVALVIPSIFFGFYFATTRRNLKIVFLISQMAFYFLVWLILMPFKDPRYIIIACGVGSILVAYCLDNLKKKRVINSMYIVILISIYYSLINSLPNIVPSDSFGYTIDSISRGKYPRQDVFYNSPLPIWINNNLHGDSIYFINMGQTYWLFGNSLDNKIYSTPGSKWDSNMYSKNEDEFQVHENMSSFSDWKYYLDRYNITYVYIGDLYRKDINGIKEVRWILENPSYFEIVFANDITQMYIYYPSGSKKDEIINEVKNNSFLINYDNKIHLQKVEITNETIHYDNLLKITYYWKPLKPINEDYIVFVHFLDGSGNIIFQQDHEPYYGLSPTSRWKPNEIIKESYWTKIPPIVPKGRYYIKIGLYNKKGRLPVVTQNNEISDKIEDIQNPDSINYNNTIEFMGYDIDKTQIGQDGKFKITYYWKSLEKTEKDHTIFVHFLNETGQIGFQDDYKPSIQTSNWTMGMIYKETKIVDVPKGAEIGDYYLFLGLYTAKEGRVPIIEENQKNKSLADILSNSAEIKNKIFDIYENKIAFLGYNIDTEEIEKGKSFKITYFWKSLAETNISDTIFVHFVDENGKIAFQQDHEPAYGIYPTSMWKPGDVITEEYEVNVPESIPPGNYSIKVGLYDRKTKKRLHLSATSDSTIIGSIIIKEKEPTIKIIKKSENSNHKENTNPDIIGTIMVD